MCSVYVLYYFICVCALHRGMSGRHSNTSNNSSGGSGRKRSGSDKPSTRHAAIASEKRVALTPPVETTTTTRATAARAGPVEGAARAAGTSPNGPARCWPTTT